MTLPNMPAGWRPTTYTSQALEPDGSFSHTHQMRLWVYDPTGTAKFPRIDQVPEDQRRWVREPAGAGLSPCCP